MRICGNCRFYAPDVSVLTIEAKRHPCTYPVPEYMSQFFTYAKNRLATEGRGCAVHKLEGEE